MFTLLTPPCLPFTHSVSRSLSITKEKEMESSKKTRKTAFVGWLFLSTDSPGVWLISPLPLLKKTDLPSPSTCQKLSILNGFLVWGRTLYPSLCWRLPNFSWCSSCAPCHHIYKFIWVCSLLQLKNVVSLKLPATLALRN